jgi:hypothetical protein
MSDGTKWQCDRALALPTLEGRGVFRSPSPCTALACLAYLAWPVKEEEGGGGE